MSDLISRQDAIDTIRKFQTYKLFEKDNMLLVDQAEVMTELMMLPSAESKTGKWVLDPNGMDWNIPAWRCSECGFVANYIGVEVKGIGNNPMNWAGSKFCPQCGARIIGYER